MAPDYSKKRELIRAFKSVANCYNNLLTQHFEALGLTASQGEVLLCLYQTAAFPVQTTDLLQVFQISPASLSGTLRKLEEKGYIAYAREQEDNRRKEITLTKKAIVTQTLLETKMRSLEDAVYQEIEDSDCIAVRQTLETIITMILQFPALTLCNSANGGKASIFRRFRHLPFGRVFCISRRIPA